MLYILIFFFVFTVFFLTRNRQTGSNVFLLLMLVSLTTATVFFTLYLAKDNYYYHIINNYFMIHPDLWKRLIFFPVHKDSIIRLLNISTLLFIYSSVCFPIAFTSVISKPLKKKIIVLLSLPLIIQLFVYDPHINKIIYLYLYPDWISSHSFQSIQNIVYILTRAVNTCYLASGICLMVYTYIRSSPIRLIKSYIFLLMINHGFIVLAYSLVFLWAPSFLVRISKIALYVTYNTIPLGRNTLIYQAFPFFVFFSFGAIAFAAYRYSLLQRKIQTTELEISRNIDAANVTSSVFCHYMKNELLAIMAELENLKHSGEKSEPGANTIESIYNRCEKIYERLDAIHRSTKTAKLNLKPTPVSEPVRMIVEKYNRHDSHPKISYQYDNTNPQALLDTEYFSQVMENIINNALDAVKNSAAEEPEISIKIETQDKWIILSIQDNGEGIPERNIDKIFNPFFSSKPTSTNWGIGLSVCHKIINALEGKIEVESQPGFGTTFRILLPLLFPS